MLEECSAWDGGRPVGTLEAMSLDPRQLYVDTCLEVWQDGRASRWERRQLERLRGWLGIPAEAGKAMEAQVREKLEADPGAGEFDAEAFVKRVVDKARAGGRRPPEGEVTLLEQLALTFEVPPTKLDEWLGGTQQGPGLLDWQPPTQPLWPQEAAEHTRPEAPVFIYFTAVAFAGGGALFLLLQVAVAASQGRPEGGLILGTVAVLAGLGLTACYGDPMIGYCWERPWARRLLGASLALGSGTLAVGSLGLAAWAAPGWSRVGQLVGVPVILALTWYILIRPAWAATVFFGSRHTSPMLSRAFDLWEMIAEAVFDD